MRKTRLLRSAVFAVVIIGLLALSSCNLFKSTFTIYNSASVAIDYVRWTDSRGVTTYFGDDSVFDTTLGYNVTGIASGSWSSREVGKGTDYIFFFWADLPTHWRTVDPVTVTSLADTSFTFTDSTLFATAQINGHTQTQTFKIVPVPGDKQSEQIE